MDALSVLQRLGAGRLLGELNEALNKTATEVVESGKSGTVTISLKVSNKSQGDPMVIIDETISRSAPKKDPKGALFFAVDGELYKEDPRQVTMDGFRTVDTTTGEIREPEVRERVERTIR